ncbi:galactokinase [Geothrix sp. PMB-07]|uniref:galactokinase n=1 Tax=Geothrix sp. PMB-07 TaxID=3068640 RepID=UPI0027420E40|nr:galactokinase [Geothrix sp. PMB-07]WLT31607.1 galactokinase [Geothrix sp. PMB-07]
MTGAEQYQRIRRAFKGTFGEPGLVVRGPGRVNLIGEHTDFNLGFVLPAAVDKAIWLALRPRTDDLCRFHAVDLNASCEVRTSERASSDLRWPNYLLGVYSEMAADGRFPRGVDCVFGGDVPIGSGMSSSAALECGFAFGLNELFQLGYDRLELAQLGQRAENRFVGVNCGIMDQFASVLGRDQRLIRLDCRDLSHAFIPFEDPGLVLVLCDTRVRRSLAAGGEYNARRAQCEAGVAHLQARHPEVQSLRDASLDLLETQRDEMDPSVFQRCAYIVKENQRVLDACDSLSRGDYEAFGQRMNESHAGLRDGYEVSCPELDVLAERAQALPGVLGSRMMGAGFGGCTINLVREAELERFEAEMAKAYRQDLKREPLIHVCRLTGGTEIVEAGALLV